MAALHAASFHRGWSEHEFEQLLLDRNVVAHRAALGGKLVGFILSRMADRRSGNPVDRRRPIPARQGLGAQAARSSPAPACRARVHAVFLEVDEANRPARRLYERAGFRKSAGERDIMAGQTRRRWCCGAIWREIGEPVAGCFCIPACCVAAAEPDGFPAAGRDIRMGGRSVVSAQRPKDIEARARPRVCA